MKKIFSEALHILRRFQLTYTLSLSLALAFTLTPASSYAGQKGFAIFIDSETTTWLQDISIPLIKSAGIHKDDIRFHLIAENEVNAFVTHSRDLFVNTGLILKAENGEEVLGVLAHEIGHIEGRHTNKFIQNKSKIALPAIIGGVLGVGAAALGNADAATALIIGGQAATGSSQLQFTRAQEREADSNAITLLHENAYSAEGLYTFFQKLRGDQLLYSQTPPAYLLSHPLPSERMASVEAKLEKEDKTRLLKHLDETRFKLIQAKMFAFTNTPIATLRKFRDTNQVDHLYARSIALALQGKTNSALKVIDKLLERETDRPHIYELKAQIELDTGDLAKSEASFNKALSLRDDLPIVRLQYGETLSSNGKNKEAIPQLLRVVQEEPEWPRAHHSLALAYGRNGDIALSHLSLFDEAKLKGNLKEAEMHLKTAEENIKSSTPVAQKKLETYKKMLKSDIKN